MSRTKRKDRFDKVPRKPTAMFMGKVYDPNPTEEDKLRASMDKKKWYKPNKGFKKAQRKKDANKPKQKIKEAFSHGDDWDAIILPDAKKHDVWDYL